MQESTWVGITSMRSQAGSSLILPFVLMHGVVLVIIAFGGDALGDSSVQLAVAAFSAPSTGTISEAQRFIGGD